MNDLKRYIVNISGMVQGVGMRPYIYKTAERFHLGGWTSNQGTSVVIEISGRKPGIRNFLTALLKEPPPGSFISTISIKPLEYIEYHHFEILNSTKTGNLQGFIPPDAAVCEECIKEIHNKNDRRYQYPFTSCSSCGPRYSIIKALPYDRNNTSMASFEMCPSCRKEYESACNRRFHAQTNCCPDCGPSLSLFDNKGRRIESDSPVNTVRALILQGKRVAIKGIGGYHLSCNACDGEAIRLLRLKKKRPDRPLAIMAASIDDVKQICQITSETEEDLLTGRQRPIVLLEKRTPNLLPFSIAPRLNRLGVMLPYTPLHDLLFDEKLRYLVMTSGNISGMPICYRDKDVFEKLNDAADYFLVHDREILTPVDDSIVRVIDGREMISRCARGYAPYALPMDSSSEIMAVGAEQKSKGCDRRHL